MADAVTSQILVDGERNVVMKFTNVSDGTGEAAVLKVDVSALSGAPTSVKITGIDYDVSGMGVNILWDATTDVPAFVLGQGQAKLDFSKFGGLINNAGAGVTGDILFSTIGHTASDTYSIVLHMKKN
jgi:hypothetical protein